MTVPYQYKCNAQIFTGVPNLHNLYKTKEKASTLSSDQGHRSSSIT